MHLLNKLQGSLPSLEDSQESSPCLNPMRLALLEEESRRSTLGAYSREKSIFEACHLKAAPPESPQSTPSNNCQKSLQSTSCTALPAIRTRTTYTLGILEIMS